MSLMAPFGLAFSEIESSQLEVASFSFMREEGANFVHFCQHLVFIVVIATQFRHERELVRVRLISVRL